MWLCPSPEYWAPNGPRALCSSREGAQVSEGGRWVWVHGALGWAHSDDFEVGDKALVCPFYSMTSGKSLALLGPVPLSTAGSWLRWSPRLLSAVILVTWVEPHLFRCVHGGLPRRLHHCCFSHAVGVTARWGGGLGPGRMRVPQALQRCTPTRRMAGGGWGRLAPGYPGVLVTPLNRGGGMGVLRRRIDSLFQTDLEILGSGECRGTSTPGKAVRVSGGTVCF